MLSIIVPVYNVESYLSRCIDSVLNQTFVDWELILVDDGSTDASGIMCDDYAKKDFRIKVVHKENGGASSARNIGLDKAKGDYIMFVDPDDILGTRNTIEKNINLLMNYNGGKCFIQFPTLWWVNEEESSLLGKEQHIYKKCLVMPALFDGHITTTVWDKIYKREVFCGVRFPNLRYYEDSYFIIDILNNVDTVIISDQGYYKYYIRRGSSMQSELTKRKVEDFFCMAFKSMEQALSIKSTGLYRAHLFLEMEDKLAYGKSLFDRDSLKKYCNCIMIFIPEYKAIISYIIFRNIRKGIKLLIIKLIGLRTYLQIK